MFKKIFKKEKIDTMLIKKLDYQIEWDGPGIIFYVKNGKGLLTHQYGSDGAQGLLSLSYKGIPLIKFHSDNYFCPTCEELISAGYGLDLKNDETFMKLHKQLNAPFLSLEDSFNRLKPLFGLLKEGYYALTEKNIKVRKS